MTNFTLQFEPALIPGLVKEYMKNEGSKDTKMEEAGRKLERGDYSFENLSVICKWKSPRPINEIEANPNERREKALRSACEAADEETALRALVRTPIGGGLWGVQVRMASAILTAISPEKFTVIDFRSLQSLGVFDASYTVPFYVKYLKACRRIAEEVAEHIPSLPPSPLRNLDRALWQRSKNLERIRQDCG